MCCNKFVLQLFFAWVLGTKHNSNLAFQGFGCQVDPHGQHPTGQITPAVLLPHYFPFCPLRVVVWWWSGGGSHEDHFAFALMNGLYSRHSRH
jgi:hypothetical protein